MTEEELKGEGWSMASASTLEKKHFQMKECNQPETFMS